ncbi:MAG: hypothetical protein K0U86_14805 [Planctomycetes bacterium]|nr:hypothetical protein [Planctomycetota bacterium]MCH9726167.1 hypothetical protein [Planctomycetota bacterium]MCH9775673.1 hypothetical protein [Planctomycetota bacterium]MCH9790445.1 hypothetical protein [Planctomycetota bacterium]MDF1744494.1 hypothetical protein [Gimesia sp.]
MSYQVNPTHLRIPRPVTVTRTLLVTIGVLLSLSLCSQLVKYGTGHDTVFGIIPLLYVDYEGNLPTWYSSIALLLSSVVLCLIAMSKRAEKDQYTFHWFFLSGLFFLLSMDEVASIHECAIEPMRKLIDAKGVLHYAWVIPGGIFVLLVAGFMLRFLISLPARTRNLFLLAGAVFVGGAIGIEMVSAFHAFSHGEKNLLYSLIITLEEAMEMLGVIIFIHASLEYLCENVQSFQIELPHKQKAAG